MEQLNQICQPLIELQKAGHHYSRSARQVIGNTSAPNFMSELTQPIYLHTNQICEISVPK